MSKEVSARRDQRRASASPVFGDMESLLENVFATTPYPSREERLRIGAVLNREEKSINLWFQNRRAKVKRALRKSGLLGPPVAPGSRRSLPLAGSESACSTPLTDGSETGSVSSPPSPVLMSSESSPSSTLLRPTPAAAASVGNAAAAAGSVPPLLGLPPNLTATTTTTTTTGTTTATTAGTAASAAARRRRSTSQTPPVPPPLPPPPPAAARALPPGMAAYQQHQRLLLQQLTPVVPVPTAAGNRYAQQAPPPPPPAPPPPSPPQRFVPFSTRDDPFARRVRELREVFGAAQRAEVFVRAGPLVDDAGATVLPTLEPNPRLVDLMEEVLRRDYEDLIRVTAPPAELSPTMTGLTFSQAMLRSTSALM